MIRQRTIKRIVRATGNGIDSGRRLAVTLRPAPAGSGILFRRIDLQPQAVVGVSLVNSRECGRESVLEQAGVRVVGSWHLQAALAGMGIDNAWVDLAAPEVPLLGVGTGPFAYLVQSAGVREQDAPRRFLRVRRRVVVDAGDRYALLEPFDGFRITLDDAAAGVGVESRYSNMDFSAVPFMSEVQGAFASDRCSSAQTAPAPALPDSNFRETFLKQRLLASLGDLSLLGRSVIGSFSGRGTGRALNRRLLRKLLADESAWEEIVFDPGSRGGMELVPG